MSDADSAFRQRRARRGLIASCLGNTLEWFDWVIYAQFATLIAANYFPSSDPGAALLGTLAIFATGFFFRPLGGLVLTAYADRRGRRAGLIVSVSCMAVGALGIGLAPSYGTVGILAPLLLFLARALQGFSTGGEFSSIGSYLAEIAPPGRRGVYGSLHYVSATLGALLATAVAWLLREVVDPAALATWAWRLPFVLGAVLGLITLWLRRNMEESHTFETSVSGDDQPRKFLDLAGLWEHRAAVARLFVLSGYVGVWYYTFASYLPSYTIGLGMSPTTALGIGTLALVIFTLAMPLVGALSDQLGRRPMLLGCVGLSALAAVPVFALNGPHAGRLLAAQTVALLIFTGFAAIGPIALAEQFPTRVRTLGAGLPYALGVAVFGGTAPLLLEWLGEHGLTNTYPWYLAAVSAVAFVAMLGLKETFRDDLADAPQRADRRVA